jgi:hypothetical protein
VSIMEQDTTSGVNSGAGYYIGCQKWSRILHRVSVMEQDTTSGVNSGADTTSGVNNGAGYYIGCQ